MKKPQFFHATLTSLPPPYEAAAYPSERLGRRFVTRSHLSPRTVLSAVLTICVFWLCLLARRAPRGSTVVEDKQFAEAHERCHSRTRLPPKPNPAARTKNSRWAAEYGQVVRIILQNATLFDGEVFASQPVDIAFSRGLIESVTVSGSQRLPESAKVYNLHGRYVTPGLVDMHSHHMVSPWPATEMTTDIAEVHEDTKAVTSMMRIMDALKAYDKATTLIASGGITTSLIIPGSANLIGGEGTAVKNALHSGPNREPVVEDLLLERGLPPHERRRYMKMALGENPKGVWGYSRLGNAWHLREHFHRAKDILEAQDDYCAGLEMAKGLPLVGRTEFIDKNGKFPSSFEYESVIALLRGQVLLHNHNYEPEDMETMIRISEEFGYEISGFHHATEAWQIPGLLKQRLPNVTIAIFAEFSLYKHEAYWPSLYAGHILDKNGIKVAYKSDHAESFTNAKFLLSQAAIAHSFNLPADKALRAVTSVPAAAIDQDHRVGHCKIGFDADIVIWDDHPLNVGATPLQVFIDGVEQLDATQVEMSMGNHRTNASIAAQSRTANPQMKYEIGDRTREETCKTMASADGNIIISGISRVFLEHYSQLANDESVRGTGALQLVINNGKITCLATAENCTDSRDQVKAKGPYALLDLANGHLVPGLTALTNALGMREITTDPSTGDGNANGQSIADHDSVAYAKYGVWLDGKAFSRARLGGVTRAITPPLSDDGAFVSGVSVEIITSGKRSLLNGGIIQQDVALHVALGDNAAASEGAVSNGVRALRKMLGGGLSKHNETIYGRVASGDIPLLVHANNKKDFRDTKIVLVGGREAPFVARDLAATGIPVILTEDRGGPTSFRTKDAIVGPPLTRSVASYLKEAGVKFGLALLDSEMRCDFKIHDLLPEASWTAKYAGLSDAEAVQLVTSNIEDILDLTVKNRDIVVFEGDPLRYGATVAVTLAASNETDRLEIAGCFPRENEVIVTPEMR